MTAVDTVILVALVTVALVVSIILLAIVNSEEGYEDDTGYHIGPTPPDSK